MTDEIKNQGYLYMNGMYEGKSNGKEIKKELANHEHDILKLIDKVEYLEMLIMQLNYKINKLKGGVGEKSRAD